MNRFHRYIAGVVVAAGAMAVLLFLANPTTTPQSVRAVALLCGLALIAEAMTVVLSRSVSASIAFIPYLASIIVAPGWVALIGVSIVRVLFEYHHRRRILMGLFNLAAHALTFATTVLVYQGLGGVALTSLQGHSLLDITRLVGIQAMVAVMFSLAVNGLLVSGYIAAKTSRTTLAVWRETFLSTIGFDILAAPVIFIFAWVYVAFGAIAASVIWMPILGIRQIHKANLDLEQTNRELLELMVKSIEARDPYTSGHSRRVHEYSLSIARCLKLSEKMIERVGQAALLHDIGKIHEKYAPILRNPNRLSPDEWLIMKEHPADGASLISTVSGLRVLVEPVRSHHENWDGSGYPSGLAGELIPVEARIIMFADTIDAMTSERPYRNALGEPEVRAEIVRCRGKQFDPAIADQLLGAGIWRTVFGEAKAGARQPLALVDERETA